MRRIARSFLEAAVGQESWAGALAHIADSFGAMEAHFTVWDRVRSQVQFSVRAGRFPSDAVESYTRYFYSVDSCREKLIWSQVGDVMLTQNYDQGVFLRSEIYNDFLRPLGARYVMGIKLIDSGSAVAMLRIHRNSRNGPYTDEHVQRLRFLFPHLSQAAQYHSTRSQLARKANLAAIALDHLDTGIILLDSSRYVLQANAAAQNLLNDDDAILTIRDGRLVAKRVDADVVLRKSIEAACNKGSSLQGCSGFSQKLGGNELTVAPLRGDNNVLLEDAAIITLKRVHNQFENLCGKLKTTYGLTQSEAAIAEQIARGRTVQEITVQSTISVNTVKTHLKAVFLKMGVKSQSDLVRTALRLNK
jgi:DNA-binding CsgD family transcriptional regulator